MKTVADLVREVDEAAEKLKELALEPPSDENADQMLGNTFRGLAALMQLSSRALAPAASRTEDDLL